MMDQGFRTAFVYVRDTFAGTLQETDAGYQFQYDDDYLLDAEAPANGGLFANAKISAEALKKLTETDGE